MKLVLDWLKKLGYKNDPFVDEPTAALVGLADEREAINLFLIKQLRVATIAAADGMGKTSLALWLKKELTEHFHAHIVDPKVTASREQLEQQLYQELTNAISRIGSKDHLVHIKKKFTLEQHVLIIDNAGNLAASQINFLEELLTTTKAQLILLDSAAKLKKCPVKTDLQLEIDKYDDDTLAQVLTRRIEEQGSVGTFPFDETERNKLFKKAKGNPRTLLDLARERAIELSLKGIPLPKEELRERTQKKPSTLDKQETEPRNGAQKSTQTSEPEIDRSQGKTTWSFSLFGKWRFEFYDPDEEQEEPTRKTPSSKQKNNKNSDKEDNDSVKREDIVDIDETEQMLSKLLEQSTK